MRGQICLFNQYVVFLSGWGTHIHFGHDGLTRRSVLFSSNSFSQPLRGVSVQVISSAKLCDLVS